MNSSTIYLGSKESGRREFLIIQSILKLHGFEAIEVREEQDRSSPELENPTIYLPKSDNPSPVFSFPYADLSKRKQVEDILERRIFPHNMSQEEEKWWQKLCSSSIFSYLYTIDYLYANKFRHYNDTSLLRKGIYNTSTILLDLETTLTEAKNFSWQLYYAYCYLVEYVNSGMKRLRSFTFRDYKEILPYLNQIDRLSAKQREEETIALLKANLLNSQYYLSSKDAYSAYNALKDSNNDAIRYTSNYILGTCKQLSLEQNHWEQLSETEKAAKMHQIAIPHYLKCREILPQKVQILYKLAFQKEREGYQNSNIWLEARELYSLLISIIEKIPASERYPVEFQYLYQSYRRLEYIEELLGNNKEAIKLINHAENCWQEADDSLSSWVYQEENVAYRILDNEYKNRDHYYAIARKRVKSKEYRPY